MPNRNIKLLFLICVVSSLLGCSNLKTEVRYIETEQKLLELNVEHLQNTLPDSTDLLLRAENWLKSSEQILNSVE